jgi:exopolysaccharide biosynthesis polyprenyl glycosylphosphotransferase
MNRKNLTSKLVLILSSLIIDALLVLGAEIAGFFLRFGLTEGPFPRPNFTDFLRLLLPIIALRLLCFFIYGLYDKPKYKTLYDTVLNIIKATTASTLVIMVAAFLFRAFAYPRTVIFYSWLLTIILIIAWRMTARRLINLLLGKDYFISHTLIVGTDHNAQRIATRLLREAHVSRRLVGFISLNRIANAQPRDPFHLGGIADIPRLIETRPIDEVVIASQMPKETILSIFALFSQTDVVFRIVPSLYEATIGSMAGSPTELVPMISPISNRLVRYKDLKRLLDTAVALIGLIVFSPLFLLIALAVKLSSPGPVFYRQERAGLHGRHFMLYKFRTMFSDSEADGPEFALPSDPRVTKVGRFLRRFRLDELPQLYNVLINEMSLIGPRPERPVFVRELVEKIPFYAERLEVKPGITGWAQVTYGYSTTTTEHREKLLYDIFYLENMSLALDGLIMLKTLGVILRGKGAQ